MSKRSTASKYAKLLLKHEYLQLELEEHREEHETRKREFDAAYRAIYATLDSEQKERVEATITKKNLAAPDDKASRSPLDTASRDDLKELYKKVARETHPDKYEHMDDESLRKEKVSLFKEIKELYENDDWVGLSQAAKDLNVELPEISHNQVHYLKASIERIESKIKEITETVAWKWYDRSEEQKEGYMRTYLNALAADAL